MSSNLPSSLRSMKKWFLIPALTSLSQVMVKFVTINGGIGHISYPNVGSGSFNFSSTGNSNWDDVVYSIKVYHKVGSTQLAPTDASLEIKYVKPYIWGVVDNDVNVTNIDSSIIEYLHAQGNKLVVPEQSNEIDFQRPSGILKSKFVYAYDASY